MNIILIGVNCYYEARAASRNGADCCGRDIKAAGHSGTKHTAKAASGNDLGGLNSRTTLCFSKTTFTDHWLASFLVAKGSIWGIYVSYMKEIRSLHDHHQQRIGRGGGDEAVDTVEHAAMAGNELAGILHPGAAFKERFH